MNSENTNLNENDNLNEIIVKINELKGIQAKLDEALVIYKESIAELEKAKDQLVPEVMEAFKGQTKGAEKLKISIDNMLVEIVQASETSNVSYKDAFNMALKKVNENTKKVLEQIKEDSKVASKVKGQLKIDGSKVFEGVNEMFGKVTEWLSNAYNKIMGFVDNAQEGIDEIESMIKNYEDMESDNFATQNMDDVESGNLTEEVGEKTKNTIDNWRSELGDRKTAIKLINYMLSRMISMSSGDLADTATYANGIDGVEDALVDGDYKRALNIAADTAKEMIDEEGFGDMFEGVNVSKTNKKDSEGRPIYKSEDGEKYVDVSLGKSKKPELHSVTKEGEPNTPLKNFVIKEDIGMFNDPIGYDKNAKSKIEVAREILEDAGLSKEEIDKFISDNMFKKGRLDDRAKEYVNNMVKENESWMKMRAGAKGKVFENEGSEPEIISIDSVKGNIAFVTIKTINGETEQIEFEVDNIDPTEFSDYYYAELVGEDKNGISYEIWAGYEMKDHEIGGRIQDLTTSNDIYLSTKWNKKDDMDDMVSKYDDQESGKYTQNMDDVESGILPEEEDQKLNETVNRFKQIINY
jgi:hypothetical protein